MTLLGTLLGGRYRLDAEIGRGGMSTVYRAFDTVLERPVAIKLMHREIAADSAQLERFRREARAVAQLNHPHIVTVIDAGEEPSAADDGVPGRPPLGTPYIVLEYVEGETLKQLIRREGPLDVSQSIAYAIEIARAIGAAHERLIVHRDVKPQNVLIGSEGSAKITDFGIARTLTEEGLTIDGRVLGTTDYVSPEQALGQPVTGQSDLYSLGVVLYEMLTGEVPFAGETPVAVAMRHVREQVPDVQSRRPEVSAATAAVVERATAVDLHERYPNAAAMVSDLEEALAIEAARAGQATGEVTSVLRTLPRVSRRRLPWRMRHPARWAASLALLGAIVALALVLAARHTHKGVAPNVGTSHGLQAIRLGQTAAHDYNPFGTGAEHPSQVSNVLDGDPNTTWSTEHYVEGTLGHKPGVGLYLDAAPGVEARAIEIQTPTPSFTAIVYASNGFQQSLAYGDATPLTKRGWAQLAPARTIGASTTIALRNPSDAVYRYYLIWIVKLPPSSEVAEISEVTLFK
ncbi:MAG TPA: protein kinase [Solirubrobacteraceae bacterium]|nr:protein kinase [Solirubrobacteraceae bacterium]